MQNVMASQNLAQLISLLYTRFCVCQVLIAQNFEVYFMGLYEQIRDVAKSNGYSVNKLELELGFARSSINKFNKNKPSIDKLQQIADKLGVSVDYLTGNEEPEKKSLLKPRDERDINNILSNTEQLLKQEGLMFDGNPASPEAIESILSAMKIGMEMAKEKNKKYTPKKYIKD